MNDKTKQRRCHPERDRLFRDGNPATAMPKTAGAHNVGSQHAHQSKGRSLQNSSGPQQTPTFRHPRYEFVARCAATSITAETFACAVLAVDSGDATARARPAPASMPSPCGTTVQALRPTSRERSVRPAAP
ncbi:MAG: hypothetical protein MZV49_27325 [Rhodopseudomonas palustris]|nr:hypothetical protein [Rhodopseudomonas palustris]